MFTFIFSHKYNSQTYLVTWGGRLYTFPTYTVSIFFFRSVRNEQQKKKMMNLADIFQESEKQLLSAPFYFKLSSRSFLQPNSFVRLQNWLWLIILVIFMCVFYQGCHKHINNLYQVPLPWYLIMLFNKIGKTNTFKNSFYQSSNFIQD